jgi:hypothetical protein
VTPPCRRDATRPGVRRSGVPGPAYGRHRTGLHSPGRPFSQAGCWLVSAQIYLGCTCGGPSGNLGSSGRSRSRAGLAMMTRAYPRTGMTQTGMTTRHSCADLVRWDGTSP